MFNVRHAQARHGSRFSFLEPSEPTQVAHLGSLKIWVWRGAEITDVSLSCTSRPEDSSEREEAGAKRFMERLHTLGEKRPFTVLHISGRGREEYSLYDHTKGSELRERES